jgi:hypothetical protein
LGGEQSSEYRVPHLRLSRGKPVGEASVASRGAVAGQQVRPDGGLLRERKGVRRALKELIPSRLSGSAWWMGQTGP